MRETFMVVGEIPMPRPGRQQAVQCRPGEFKFGGAPVGYPYAQLLVPGGRLLVPPLFEGVRRMGSCDPAKPGGCYFFFVSVGAGRPGSERGPAALSVGRALAVLSLGRFQDSPSLC